MRIWLSRSDAGIPGHILIDQIGCRIAKMRNRRLKTELEPIAKNRDYSILGR